jgi:hypothetical protein
MERPAANELVIAVHGNSRVNPTIRPVRALFSCAPTDREWRRDVEEQGNPPAPFMHAIGTVETHQSLPSDLLICEVISCDRFKRQMLTRTVFG